MLRIPPEGRPPCPHGYAKRCRRACRPFTPCPLVPSAIPIDTTAAPFSPPLSPFAALPSSIDPAGPSARPIDPTASTFLLEIPADLASLRASDPERANRWRIAARDAFAAAFAAGYRAVGTVRLEAEGGRRQAYVLHRPDAPLG